MGFQEHCPPRSDGRDSRAMIDRLLEVDQNAPLLNALLVEQNTKLPSDGADGIWQTASTNRCLSKPRQKNAIPNSGAEPSTRLQVRCMRRRKRNGAAFLRPLTISLLMLMKSKT